MNNFCFAYFPNTNTHFANFFNVVFGIADFPIIDIRITNFRYNKLFIIHSRNT